MEQQYWKDFVQTGGVTEYLTYKMEVYGHCPGEYVTEGNRGKQCESDYSNRYGASVDADRGI